VSTPVELILLEAGLPDDAVADLGPLLTELRDLEPEHAPEPGPELARLLAAPAAPTRVGAGRRSLVVAATLLGTSMTATGVAAAANELPEPAQRLVSQLSERYLPFEFPPPEPAPEPESEPATEPLPPAVEGPSGEGPAPAGSAETGTLPVGRPTGTPTPSARSTATPSSGAGTPTPTSSPAPEPTGSPAGEVAGPPEGAAPAPGVPEETAGEATPTADPSAAPTDAAARDDGRTEDAQQPQTPAPTPEATLDPAALAPAPPAG
jgi:hypothetical protein